jgi:hypothetical protein
VWFLVVRPDRVELGAALEDAPLLNERKQRNDAGEEGRECALL